MPKIFERDGFRVFIYPNDHSPAHVHIWKAEGQVIIELDPIRIRRFEAMRRKNVSKAVEIVEENQVVFLEKWSEIDEKRSC